LVEGVELRATASENAGTSIAGRLSGRRSEIEQITLARAYGIAEPPGAAELDYLHGLREAVSAAVDFGLQALSASDDRLLSLPPVLLVQARLAARNGVALEVVLRRYFSGYTVFMNFVFEEAQRAPGSGVQRSTGFLRSMASQFDRLVSAVAEEHQREVVASVGTAPELQTRLVERLLAGEVLDASPLAYDVHGSWHLATVFSDQEGAAETLRAVAERLNCRLLYVPRRTGSAWAWLGRRGPLDPIEMQSNVERAMKCTPIAVGQPAHGLVGWRLSHCQARTVYPVVQRRGEVVSYAQAGLVATIAKDEVLIASLRQLYIEPLDCGPDSGVGLKETVRAYLSAGRNISSAASKLRISRQTVRVRLRMVEDKIGRSLDECGAEMEIALRLEREFSGDT
jgi:hypothetical protein